LSKGISILKKITDIEFSVRRQRADCTLIRVWAIESHRWSEWAYVDQHFSWEIYTNGPVPSVIIGPTAHWNCRTRSWNGCAISEWSLSCLPLLNTFHGLWNGKAVEWNLNNRFRAETQPQCFVSGDNRPRREFCAIPKCCNF